MNPFADCDFNGCPCRFSEDIRPVPLRKVVIGYPYNPQCSSPFKFDIMLSYKLQSILDEYSEGKPVLVRKKHSFFVLRSKLTFSGILQHPEECRDDRQTHNAEYDD